MSQRQREAEAQRRMMKAQRVVIAFIHPGDVAGAFMDSVCQTILVEGRPDGLLDMGGGYLALQSGPRIAEARTQVVETFLTTEDYGDAQWLFMVDSDMTFEPDAIRRLVEAADPVERPILGGLCFAGSSPENCRPTLYRLDRDEESKGWVVNPVTEYPEGAIVKVGGTGAAALLVHRSVLQRMYAAFKVLPSGQANAYPWFVEGHVDYKGHPLGEDIAFCIRAQGMGIPVHVHTGIEFGHRKNVILNQSVWKANRP